MEAFSSSSPPLPPFPPNGTITIFNAFMRVALPLMNHDDMMIMMIYPDRTPPKLSLLDTPILVRPPILPTRPLVYYYYYYYYYY